MKLLRHRVACRLVKLAAAVEMDRRASAELDEFWLLWGIQTWARLKTEQLRRLDRRMSEGERCELSRSIREDVAAMLPPVPAE